jgi:hypothetical protein
MCLRTWGSHSIDGLLLMHHQQVPLPPAVAVHRAVSRGVRIPQIWRLVVSIATAKPKARLQHGACGSWGRPRIATECAEVVRFQDVRDDAVYVLRDDVRRREELSLELFGEFGIGCLPELSILFIYLIKL